MAGKKRFRDFDRFWEEKDEAPIEFQVLGRTYTVPAAPRAATVLQLKRLREAEGMDMALQGEVMVDVVEPLLGKEQMQQMFDDGITLLQLQDVLEWLVEMYQDPAIEEQKGDARGKG